MNKKKFSDSLIMIFTYTINSARMLDMNHFRQHKNHRITALVDSELKYLFTPYEPLFDDVYYFEIHYKHHCFIESFSKVAKDAIIKELALCERLKLISFFEGDIEATAKLRDQFHLSGLRFSHSSYICQHSLFVSIGASYSFFDCFGRLCNFWFLYVQIL